MADAAQLVKADDDKDGEPGVTTPAEKGPGFANPVVSLLDGQRASVLYVASRTVVVLRGTALSCDELRGSLEVPNINGAPAFDSAIVGCRLSSNGALCNQSQADFVNTNGPDFRPTSGATFVQRRVREGFTCGEVRGMYPRFRLPLARPPEPQCRSLSRRRRAPLAALGHTRATAAAGRLRIGVVLSINSIACRVAASARRHAAS